MNQLALAVAASQRALAGAPGPDADLEAAVSLSRALLNDTAAPPPRATAAAVDGRELLAVLAAPPPASPAAAARGLAARALDRAWDALHTGPWRDVPPGARSLYAACALLHVTLEQLCDDEPGDAAGGARGLRGCLRTLDVALMLGAPGDREALHAAVRAVEAQLPPSPAGVAVASTAAAVAAAAVPPPDPTRPPGTTPVPAVDDLSLPAFWRDYMCFAAPAGRASVYDDHARASSPPATAAAAVLGRPVVLRGAVRHWPALARWADAGYLLRAAGHRTVPVEVGGHYMSAGWGTQLMTLRAFLDACGGSDATAGAAAAAAASAAAPSDAGERAPSPESACFAYLAQHALFDQIPALRADILQPDYCSLRAPARPADDRTSACDDDAAGGALAGAKRRRLLVASSDGGGAAAEQESSRLGDGDDEDDGDADAAVAVNAWLGPAGTISCLHFDRPHNLLCQAVGWKRVLLADPRDGPALYPHEGAMGNTSQVDPEALQPPPCAQQGGSSSSSSSGGDGPFPLAGGVRFYCAVLGPGDALYIPPRWWHHVRALSASFSVSWWWG